VSVADDFAAAVRLLRSWGVDTVEWSGCYGRSNGGSWAAGRPVGHVNHHYVCSLQPDQAYIDGLVQNLANGTTVQWFADVNGVAYLIGVGPMNHAGTGMSSVLDLTRADQPPPSFPASSAGDISGNPHYSGTECQHPGDSTPWPAPMLDTMVAINAAEFLTWGYTAARAINHAEWSARKLDMSAGGGVSSDGWAGAELRRRVAARMSGGGSPTPTPPGTDDDEDDTMRNLYCIRQSQPGGKMNGALWVSDLQTRRWMKDGNLAKAMIGNAAAIDRTDGAAYVTYWLLKGGKWVPFTNWNDFGSADGQTALEQFGADVGPTPLS
jgi:hypothetical protein